MRNKGLLTVITILLLMVFAGSCNKRKKRVKLVQDTTPPVTIAEPPGGSYLDPVTVTLTSDEPATIYYTTDGSEPTAAHYADTGPSPLGGIDISENTSLKFFGIDESGAKNEESVKTQKYVIGLEDTTPPTTTADPPGGTYTSTVFVWLNVDEPATVYYTTDGSTPDNGSDTYSNPIEIAINTVLKFFAIDCESNVESVKTEVYTTGSSPLRVTTTSLPNGVTGGTYSQSVAAAGGEPPYTWTHTGDLPQGLTMDNGGLISGTPTVEETCNITVIVTDNNSDTADKYLSITIFEALPEGWTPTSTTGAPSKRWWHTGIWTGEEMIIWGGEETVWDGQLANGKIYNPKTDTWRPVSSSGAPFRRSSHTAVWTGKIMIIWGGTYCYDGVSFSALGDGFKYDPAADTWTPISDSGASAARWDHTAVWTGEEMIVWGGWAGAELGTGARYNPDTNTWIPVATTGAPTPRDGHKAYWTGTEMIVWGVSDGARYNPITDQWTPISDEGSPVFVQGRHYVGVWTGEKMIVWGGYSGEGAQFDLTTDTWTKITDVNAPRERGGFTGVWTGTEMIVWGMAGTPNDNTGGRYNLTTDTWEATTTENAPVGRGDHTAIWTGRRMIVWGGRRYGGCPNSGGCYVPPLE
jgi:N-acetylneuraminic acid mutarotase